MSGGVHFGLPRIKSQFLNWVLQEQEEHLMPEWACAEWVDWVAVGLSPHTGWIYLSRGKCIGFWKTCTHSLMESSSAGGCG